MACGRRPSGLWPSSLWPVARACGRRPLELKWLWIGTRLTTTMIGWMVGWLVGWLVVWLVGCLVAYLNVAFPTNRSTRVPFESFLSFCFKKKLERCPNAA